LDLGPLFGAARFSAMIDIDVRSNIHLLAGRLGALQAREVPFATVFALTKTAQDIRDAEYRAMRAVFDRPTRFTLNSLFVRPATRQSPSAAVQFKEGFGSVPAWRYLGPEIEGGLRAKKGHERALERAGILKPNEFVVPGARAQIDQFGNMRASEIVRILSQLRALPDPAQWASASRRSRRGRARSGIYVVIRDRAGLPNGVYRRQGSGLAPVMIFVRPPRYAARLPFRETARQTFDRRFDVHFAAGLRRFEPRALPRVA
jgi:hypothetical protein